MRGRARKRWIVVAAVAGCAGAGAGTLPAHASTCLLACPATTTSAPTPPSASAVTLGRVTATSAALSGTVSTGGALTDWQFIATGGIGSGFGAGDVPAAPATAPVSNTVMEITPGTHYTVRLEVTNSAGATTGPSVSFSTPLEPALGATLIASRARLAIGSEVTLTGAAHGADASNDVVQLQAEGQDAHSYSYVQDPSEQFTPNYIFSGNRLVYKDLMPVRNTRYRFRLAGHYYNLLGGGEYTPRQRPSVSAPVTVLVYPTGSLAASVARPGVAEATTTFDVHALPGGYRGEPLYTYLSTSSSGPFRLIGTQRLRYQRAEDGATTLSATATTTTTGHLYFRSCVRHQLLPDMGTPFTDRRCGGATLS